MYKGTRWSYNCMRAHMYGNAKNARKIPKISLMKTNQPAHKGAILQKK